MDFLDPKKERQHRFMLLLGYCLVALAIGIATLVLLYQSYGYGVDRKGNVLQNGLVFVSSQPTGASIFLNNELYKTATNSRVSVPAGSYDVKIASKGYRDWQRPIAVVGGDVQHFDYPFLFPTELKSSGLQEFAATPTLASQSLDKRWIIISTPSSPGKFMLYDLKAPAKPLATSITLPATAWNTGDGAQSWDAVEWAADNRHVVLAHTYLVGATSTREYILVDRASPELSVNLTDTLKLNQSTTLTLFNNRITQFYLHDTADNTLSRVDAADGTVVSKLEHVVAFKSYSDNKILYASDQSPTGKATPGQVSVVLQDGQRTMTLRTLPAGGTYVLNLASYESNWYVVVGASNDTAVYVYKNPQTQVASTVDTYPAAWRRLGLKSPAFAAFSSNTQYLMAQSGQNFVVYDFENMLQYRYTASQLMDAPQLHANWMDGNRLIYVSQGKLVVFDYDYRNQQELVAASSTTVPFFAPNYSYLYAISSEGTQPKPVFSATSLLVKP